MKKKQQKIGLIVVIVIVLAVVGGLIFKKMKTQKTTEIGTEQTVVKKKKISAPINVIDLSERPIVSLKPYTENGGRFVNIELSQLRKQATAAEYEIVYNVVGASAVSASGAKIRVPDSEEQEGQQGFMGELDLASLPTKTENRFGTCSAGGACINNSVSGGSLTLTFDGTEKYAVMNNWTYFETGKEESLTDDGLFKLEAVGLAKEKDYLIASAIGLPENLPANVVMIADGGKDNGTIPLAYQINFTNAPKINEAIVNFPKNTTGKIAVWDGTKWTTYEQGEAMPMNSGYIYALMENV